MPAGIIRGPAHDFDVPPGLTILDPASTTKEGPVTGTFVLAVTLTGLLLQSSAPSTPVPAAKVKEEVRKLLAANAATGLFSGAILVARGDEVLFSGAAGLADRQFGVPNTIDTRFRICNITALFTAAAILRLQEQGKLHVSDPVGKHMRNWPDAYHAITIHQLLSGQSGVTDVTRMPAFVSSVSVPRAVQELALMILKEPPAAQPGTWSRAANSNYHLLAAVIEQAAGRGYHQYVQEEIISRAGLTQTTHDDPEGIILHRASGYTQSGPDVRNAAWFHMNNAVGMANLVSTIGDVHRFIRGLVGGRIISRESLALMTTEHVPGADLGGGARSPGTGYGLSVSKTGTQATWNIGGSINGFTASLRYDEASGDTAIVLGNVAGTSGSFSIFNAMLQSLAGREPHLPVKRTAVTARAEDLQRVAGEWNLSSAFSIGADGSRRPVVLTLRADSGRLLVSSNGGQETEYFASRPGEFFAAHTDTQIVLDPEPDAVFYVISGRKSRLTRLPPRSR